jgi:hypothetical protein
MIMYAGEGGGKNGYPRARDAATAGQPGAPGYTTASGLDPFTQGTQGSVTQALFLIARTQDITSEGFTCPSTNDSRDTFAGGLATNQINWSGKSNLSYSYQSPYLLTTGAASIRMNISMSSDFPILSDMNPGTAGGDNVATVPTATPTLMKNANTNNHDGDGQNVGYTDAHVEWFTSPYAGAQRSTYRDNIFYSSTSDANNASATGDLTHSSQDTNDSVLLPTDDQT